MKQELKLENKPLAEAIFEVRWNLQEKGQPQIFVDPQFKLLPGVLFDNIKKEYPHHESLPASEVPDEISPYIIKHRFRVGEGKFPLLQLGPGIFSVNESEGYEWDDFKERIKKGLISLFKSYGETNHLVVKELGLRYINALPFNFESNNILNFFNEKLAIQVKFAEPLFEGTKINPAPLGVNYLTSFSVENPKGVLTIALAKGKRAETESLIWEMNFKSEIKSSISDKEINEWVESAHSIIENWFFKFTSEGLLEEFR